MQLGELRVGERAGRRKKQGKRNGKACSAGDGVGVDMKVERLGESNEHRNIEAKKRRMRL